MSFNLIQPVRSPLIRRSARGMPCTFQIAGVCRYDWSTVVLCHLETPRQKGTSTKASDINAAYGCLHCHDLIDMRDERWVIHREYFEFYKRRAINRTLHLLLKQDILQIKGGAYHTDLPDEVAPGQNAEVPF